MTSDQFREIKKFNENVEWLKTTNHVQETEKMITMKEAIHLLQRQRTWIQTKMIKDLEPGMDANWYLVRDVDWIREGNRVMFKRESITRLKQVVLTAIGNKYDKV